MNEDFVAYREIYVRSSLGHRGRVAGRRAANGKNRGAMSVARFKRLAQLVWAESQGRIKDEIWSNRAQDE